MIIAALIVLIAGTVVFYIQNEIPVLVSFLNWQFESSLAAVAVVAMLAGVVLMQLVAGLRKRRADAGRRLDSWSRRHRW